MRGQKRVEDARKRDVTCASIFFARWIDGSSPAMSKERRCTARTIAGRDRSNLARRLAAFDFGDELGRPLGQLLHRAIESCTIGGCDHLSEPVHERQRA